MPTVSVPYSQLGETSGGSEPTANRLAKLGAYTHLKIPESILVAGWKPTAADVFTLDVRWPAVALAGPYDPRILTQTIRQCGLVVAHAEYDVPLDHQTMLRFLDFTIAEPFPIPDGRAAALEVEVAVTDSKNRRRSGSSLHMEFHLRCDGATVGRAESEFGWISPRVYRRVRGEYLSVDWGSWPVPEPVDAELVGRSRPEDVVLAPTDEPHRWQLRNDVANTLLFDHPVDHVPGLALVEAADQAAHAVLAPDAFRPTSVATSYARYVEFDRPCRLEAVQLPADGGRFAVEVTGVQDGERAFSAVFRG